MKKTLYFFILLMTAIYEPAQAFDFVLKGQGLSNAQVHAAESLLNQAKEILPLSFKQRLPKTFIVEFQDTAAGNHGSTRIGKNSIVLSNRFLPEMVSGNLRPALGTLLHEVAHQYDFSKLVQGPYQKERSYCLQMLKEKNSIQNKKNNVSEMPEQCYWYSHRANVSDDKRFVYALSWGEKEIIDSTIKADAQVVRSPNPYEFQSKAEAFAVNFEFYLLDPEFKCRRPTVAKFFNEHFSFQPFADKNCENSQSVLVSLATATSMTENFKKIDPTRVYQVHYLLAGSGQQMMSRWGHAMLRLVICAPERKAVGPDCMKDLSHHLVVSYRAGVTDLAIDTLKGLMGEYPSQIFMIPLLNVINEYTKMELRDLISYPLDLSRSEVLDFTTRVMEQFWSYRGKYYFITNNCAVETFNLLKHIRPGHLGLANASSLTPTGVRDLLLTHRLARPLTAKDMSEKTYFWPSKVGRYQGMIKELNQIVGNRIQDMNTIYSLTGAEDRALFEDVMAAGKGYSSLFTVMMAKMEKLAMQKNYLIFDVIQREGMDKISQVALKQLNSQKHFISSYLNGGYGLPNSLEISRAEASKSDAIVNGEDVKFLAESLAAIEEKYFDDSGKELSARIKYLESALKELVKQIKLQRQGLSPKPS